MCESRECAKLHRRLTAIRVTKGNSIRGMTRERTEHLVRRASGTQRISCLYRRLWRARTETDFVIFRQAVQSAESAYRGGLLNICIAGNSVNGWRFRVSSVMSREECPSGSGKGNPAVPCEQGPALENGPYSGSLPDGGIENAASEKRTLLTGDRNRELFLESVNGNKAGRDP